MSSVFQSNAHSSKQENFPHRLGIEFKLWLHSNYKHNLKEMWHLLWTRSSRWSVLKYRGTATAYNFHLYILIPRETYTETDMNIYIYKIRNYAKNWNNMQSLQYVHPSEVNPSKLEPRYSKLKESLMLF